MGAALVLLCARGGLAAEVTGAAPGQEPVDGADGVDEGPTEPPVDNPWIDGPEAEVPPEDAQHPGAPPRESAASVEPLQVTEPQPDPPLPLFDHGIHAGRPDLRMSTTLEREDLWRWGDMNLADALVMMPGLRWPYLQAGAPQPGARGLDSEHVGVRVDGVPVLPHEVYPGFPVLGLVPTDEVQQVTYRQGPRLGPGLEGAAGGVLDITTLPPARDLGEQGVVTGRVRAGYGGPALEKVVFLSGSVGYRRARISLAGGGYHLDQLRLGRGAGLYNNSFGLGGHLVIRGDVVPKKGVRVWGVWQGARQARTPLAPHCEDSGDGGYRDCIFTQDRSRDTVAVGLDTTHHVFGFTLSSMSRVHGQRFGEHWMHEGTFVTAREQTFTTLWRGGALSTVTVTLPSFLLLDAFSPEVAVGGELLRDRVTSQYQARSRFVSDASPSFVDDIQLMPIASGGQRSLGRAFLRAGLYGRLLQLSAEGEASLHHNVLIRPDLARMEDRIAGRLTPTLSGEVTARLSPFDPFAVFVSLQRTERPDTLFDIGRGPLAFEDEPPLPALPNHTRFVQHSAELGGEIRFHWIQLSAVGWVAERTGPRIVGTDAAEALTRPGIERLVRADRRQAGGLEARGKWVTPLDGLWAEGTFAAVAIDEGVFFRGEDPFAPVPVPLVPRPSGAAALHWAPTDWPVHLWGRLRYALPQARLAPDEALDENLCPQGVIDPQLEPCQGTFGYALYDLGVRFDPSPVLRVEVSATNALDSVWSLRGVERPGGGLGARASASLQF